MKKFISLVSAAILFVSAVSVAPVSVAEGDPPSLKADSSLILTRDGGAVCGTHGEISADTLAAEFEGAVTVKDPAGDVLEGEAKVPAGSTVTSATGGVLPVIVSGDANADGEINLSDAVEMIKHMTGWNNPLHEQSAITTFGEELSTDDVVNLLRFIAGWEVRLGIEKVVVDEEPVLAAGEDPGVELWFDDSTEKLAKDETESTGDSTYLMYCAKNELEGANMYIVPDRNLSELTFSVTPFVNSYGNEVKSEIFAFYYISMDENRQRPDPLIPIGSTYKLSVSAGSSQGFMVRASTEAGTEAGLYEAEVSISEGEREIKRAKVYLNVWDFTLDDADASQTAFGVGKYEIYSTYHIQGDNPEALNAMYKKYYDYFLENRLNPYVIPYEIYEPEADEYLNNPRVRTFAIAGNGYGGTLDKTDEQVDKSYAKMSGNQEWLDKAYFYYVDEPFTQDKFDDMRTYKEYIEEHFPGGRSMIPLETAEATGLKADTIYDLLYKYCDIYCPKVYAFTPENYRGLDKIEMFLSAEENARYGTYNEIIHGLVEKSEKVSWWYFAGAPFEPYVTYHADSKGIRLRIAGWQQKQYDVTGVLYYAVDDYRGVNPYRNVLYTTGDGRKAYGNGILVYPGNVFGIDGPIASVRVDNIRDGLEDYMYLVMIARLAGEDKMNEFMQKITRDLVDYDADSDKVYDVRCEMGALLEGLAD